MNKYILLSLFMFSSILYGQHGVCGFETIQNEIDIQHPEIKTQRASIEKKLFRERLSNSIKARKTQKNVNEIYEIPVVVHVIESKTEENKHLALTDQQIIDWIESANKMYATTYGKGFPTAGSGPNDGTVIPFRLVLAKRTPDCKPTNGIIRYDLSSNDAYNKYGLKFGNSDGAAGSDIKKIAPHWPEDGYYNIYIVIGIRGVKAAHDVLGWATFPDAPDAAYETFMKASIVTYKDDTTLAHEFGHSMGLLHPFHPQDGFANTDLCPSNNDCTKDNDKVCDTENIQSLFDKAVPTNNDINPCTNVNYQGGQYNIMNYTWKPVKFTPGQRDRAVNLFLGHRGSLVTSPAKYPPTKDYTLEPLLKPASCKPERRERAVGVGITQVKIGNIDSKSSHKDRLYTDYSLNACYRAGIYTDIPDDQPSKLVIKGGIIYEYALTAWIDFNDNGIFESNEMFRRNGKYYPFSETVEFDIPLEKISSAVKNKYIRMRIIADWDYKNSCDNMKYGETEDYAIRIVTKDFVEPGSDKTQGRIGINTEEPQATLDVREIDLGNLPEGQAQGVSFPNFTTEQREKFDKTKIKEGTMIYNTTLKCLEIFINGNWQCLPFQN